jgi:hypothetical protein
MPLIEFAQSAMADQSNFSVPIQLVFEMNNHLNYLKRSFNSI